EIPGLFFREELFSGKVARTLKGRERRVGPDTPQVGLAFRSTRRLPVFRRWLLGRGRLRRRGSCRHESDYKQSKKIHGRNSPAHALPTICAAVSGAVRTSALRQIRRI